jgi:flagellar biosynthesis/type III secretory pathway protein FliH
MDQMIKEIKEALDRMRKAGATKVEVDFQDLARIYQMLNMMRQIAEITDWCKEGYK